MGEAKIVSGVEGGYLMLELFSALPEGEGAEKLHAARHLITC
jgi:hypothetical protein